MTCTHGTLAGGSFVTYTIKVIPTEAGAVSGSASAEGGATDTDPSNDDDAITTAVHLPACTINGTNAPNTLTGKEGDEMAVKLKFETLKDMEPEAVAKQVPELQKLLELRDALTALKGPLGNLPEFRKKIQSLVTDPAAKEKLLKELGGGEEKK